jgi:hypothetical protein
MPDAPGRQPALARQAFLRPEFAHLYPEITPSVWRVADVVVDIIIAHRLQRGDVRFITRDRVLLEEHFAFRYGTPPGTGGEGRRPSDQG